MQRMHGVGAAGLAARMAADREGAASLNAAPWQRSGARGRDRAIGPPIGPVRAAEQAADTLATDSRRPA